MIAEPAPQPAIRVMGRSTIPGGQTERDPASLPIRLGLLGGPDQFQPLAVPLDFRAINEAYLRNPGVWLALRGGRLALYTESDGVRIMTRQTDIFDVAGGCW